MMNNTRPFAFGLSVGIAVALGTTALAQVFAEVNTNGELRGYIVQKDGVEICRNPTVWLQFRSTDNFIVCP